MGRRTVEELAGTPLSLLYIAGNLAAAKAAEQTLTELGIDYVLDLEPFVNVMFAAIQIGGQHTGLFIYVPTAQHRFCREMLESRGLTDTVELEWTARPEDAHGA